MRILTAESGSRKRHLGVEFAIWWKEGSWFWYLLNPGGGGGGMIGASANEAQAMRDACLSIEEILTVFYSEPTNSEKHDRRLKTSQDLAHVVY
jgi:hypothetical protein